MIAKVFTWDWRQQPDMAAIFRAVMEISQTGPVWVREVETGTDSYAWVVSGTELTDEQAWRLYLGEDEEPRPEPDWRFEWEMVGRTRGETGDAVLKHKSIEGRYRVVPEGDL